MAKPTLALIPASQGSKLFSVLPSSGVGDFDFSRGSAATRINSEGLIENVASGQSRLDYPLIDGKVVGCPHHILEPARTNLVPYSQDFSNPNWTKTGSSVVSDAAISPDGSLNAFKLVEDSSNGNHRIDTQGISITNGASYSFSMFFKYDNSVEWIRVREFGINAFAYFNIKDNTTGATNLLNNSEKIEDFGNGWKRVSFTYTSTTSGANFRIYLGDGDNVDGYQGDGTSGIYIYGAQLEAGSYPTSYIPTTTTAVTRSAETANGAGDASTFNDSEGVLMAEFSSNNQDVRWIALGSNSSNRLLFGSSGGNIRSYNNIGGTVINHQSTIDSTNNNKVAIKYKSGDTDFYINGFKAFESNSAFTVSTPFDEIQFKSLNGETQNFYGKTKQLQYYNTVLTDSELETLTSWTSFTDMANGQLYTIE